MLLEEISTGPSNILSVGLFQRNHPTVRAFQKERWFKTKAISTIAQRENNKYNR